jgi:uncharacterized protein (DUF924 family)
MHPEDIITFWFTQSAGKWFGKNDAFDTEIRNRFLPTYEKAARGETADWRGTPHGRLAEVIVLDQFPRNMFRGTARAFESDTAALRLSEDTVHTGEDKKLSRMERQFLYMPYMHSESRDAHKKAVWLFASLLPWGWGAFVYELKHKKIIDRFGRYPHRNVALGRESTTEELAFLKTNPGF